MRMVSLLDPKCFERSPVGRALTYFAKHPNVGVDRELVAALEAESERNGRCNARVCLHDSPEHNFHEMIILERPGFYFPPHRHRAKGETCHIIRGKLGVFVFDGTGALINKSVLDSSSGDNVIFRVGNDQWHVVLALTDPTIYHEGKPGPFLGPGDSEFAPWAPNRDDRAAMFAYANKMARTVGIDELIRI
jgi:cupin fold WbuC family metalloprotein